MSTGIEGLQAAVERTAEAVKTGNFAQLMSDVTPEAIAQLMQMAPAGAGQLSITSMPAISGYDITELQMEGEAHVFEVAFHSAIGRATLAGSWKQILGQWKVTGVRLVGIEPAEPAAS